MKIPREEPAKTRDRLLEAAVEIFAEKGFRESTVAEICRKAAANVAAVNYHFGGKAALYGEACRHVISQSHRAHPPDGGVSDGAPPEERLRGQVTALLRRVADKNNREFLFMHREMSHPTGLLKKAIQDEIRSLSRRTERLVRELLGPRVSETEARFCAWGIISQCVNPSVIRRRCKDGRAAQDGLPRIDDIEAYARHVALFSLGGIAAVREMAQGLRENRRARSCRKESRPGILRCRAAQ